MTRRRFPSVLRYEFRRKVVRAALRKFPGEGFGLRRPAPGETPLSEAEIFHGACHGLIRIPPFHRGINNES